MKEFKIITELKERLLFGPGTRTDYALVAEDEDRDIAEVWLSAKQARSLAEGILEVVDGQKCKNCNGLGICSYEGPVQFGWPFYECEPCEGKGRVRATIEYMLEQAVSGGFCRFCMAYILTEGRSHGSNCPVHALAEAYRQTLYGQEQK